MQFTTLNAALTALSNGETTAETVLDEFSHIDGVERAIAVAKAEHVNAKQREDVKETITDGVSI